MTIIITICKVFSCIEELQNKPTFHLVCLGILLKEQSTRRKKDNLLHHPLRVQDSVQKSRQKHCNSQKWQMTLSKLGLLYTYGITDTVTVHTIPVQVQSRQNPSNEKRKQTQPKYLWLIAFERRKINYFLSGVTLGTLATYQGRPHAQKELIKKNRRSDENNKRHQGHNEPSEFNS